MVERKMLKCSYGSFVAAVHRLKKKATPKKEEPKNQLEWGAEKPEEYDLYGDD